VADFLTLIPPSQAREVLLSQVQPALSEQGEFVEITDSIGRICAEDIIAPHPLPQFPRSTVDGYAVKAKDTFGASESTPAYIKLIAEVPMGSRPQYDIGSGEASGIHTGGMIPEGCDAVVMLENAQLSRENEIEVYRSVAPGENVISIGEDVFKGQVVLKKGKLIRPSEIGGLAALGITKLCVARKIKVGIISTGDEVVPIDAEVQLGQVRDVNSHTLAGLINSSGAVPILYGIIPDNFDDLLVAARKALTECAVVLITAGSSASSRDKTAKVINELGNPGVLVHGINTRPGKPTILGFCDGKAVIGLPGNPVSALVNGMLFVIPVIEKLSGRIISTPRPSIKATLTVNIVSQAGREDWQPVKLIKGKSEWMAEPVFGKSNLIFSLSFSDGLVCISPEETGLSAGERVDVFLF
jgi:molybdopterin molybdotransferase